MCACACVLHTHGAQLIEFLSERGEARRLIHQLTFFGMGTGGGPSPRASTDNLARSSAADRDWTLKRARTHLKETSNLLDASVLERTISQLVGDVTFLEAFDLTGRVLNITVTRSDGRAPPLLCNYLTTPNLLVYSASVASCAIPGVFEVRACA